MSILSPLTGMLRSALGVAEHEGTEALAHSPLHMTAEAEQDLDRLAHALHSAAESADRQVEVIDGLAQSLPALTAHVTQLTVQVDAMNEHAAGLTRQLEDLSTLLAPLADAEQEVSRIERLFRRGRRHRDDAR